VTFDADAFLERFWAMDAELAAHGFPAISPWWRGQIERFVRSGARRWVVRAGRRAGKSTTLCRLAVAWAWFGPWSVPPGDTAVVPFVSVSKDEAGARLRTIAAILRTLKLRSEPRGDELELVLDWKLPTERRVTFRTIACSTTAVVGFTSIAVFGDEVARWESRDTASNPAREVWGSLMPTLATQPFGFGCMCSSPWSTDDYHAELFAAGESEQQVTSHAPTWIANPTITEEQTRELEPDPRTWAREYAAEPGATVSAAFDPVDIERCYEGAPRGKRGAGFLAIDPSSLRGDAFTFIAGRETDAGEIVVEEVGGWEGKDLLSVSLQTVVEKLADRALAWDTRTIYGDSREEAGITALLANEGSGVALKATAWSEPSKDTAMQLLRRMMREHRVHLPEHAGLRRELTAMKARLMPSGRISYRTNGLDYASALLALAHAIVAGDVLLEATDWDALLRMHGPRSRGVNEPPLPFDHTSDRWENTHGRGFG
jgi:hypothetical protein